MSLKEMEKFVERTSSYREVYFAEWPYAFFRAGVGWLLAAGCYIPVLYGVR